MSIQKLFCLVILRMSPDLLWTPHHSLSETCFCGSFWFLVFVFWLYGPVGDVVSLWWRYWNLTNDLWSSSDTQIHNRWVSLSPVIKALTAGTWFDHLRCSCWCSDCEHATEPAGFQTRNTSVKHNTVLSSMNHRILVCWRLNVWVFQAGFSSCRAGLLCVGGYMCWVSWGGGWITDWKPTGRVFVIITGLKFWTCVKHRNPSQCLQESVNLVIYIQCRKQCVFLCWWVNVWPESNSQVIN